MEERGYVSKLTGEVVFSIRECIKETLHYIFRLKCDNFKEFIEACTWEREE